jgi:hypothetical protein
MGGGGEGGWSDNHFTVKKNFKTIQLEKENIKQ